MIDSFPFFSFVVTRENSGLHARGLDLIFIPYQHASYDCFLSPIYLKFISKKEKVYGRWRDARRIWIDRASFNEILIRTADLHPLLRGPSSQVSPIEAEWKDVLGISNSGSV